MEVREDELRGMLKEKGLKVTTQRIRILQVLAEDRDGHLTVEEIYDVIKEDNPEIGLATVYRTLLLFSELNLVEKMNLDDGVLRYEIADTRGGLSKHRHHHLICTECGKVVSYEDDLLDELENRIFQTTGFRVRNHEVKFFGCCKECGGK